MAFEHLSTYLNDHLAGSVAGVGILEAAIEHIKNEPDSKLLADIKRENEQDKSELEHLMAALEIGQSTFRKASGWMSEKFAEIKLRVDDPGAGELFVFEALEALSLGIEGKRSLWLVLATVSESDAKLRVLDYKTLIQRAEDQRSRVEAIRINIGLKTFL